MSERLFVGLVLCLSLFFPHTHISLAEEQETGLTKELLRGEVVLLGEVFKSQEIKAYKEQKNHPVLLTPEGEYFPIVSDWRGRAFFQDKRLRNRPVELVVQRRKGLPYLQVLMVFTQDEKGKRQYMDYWCDICSIPMYEIKPCDCCQQEIRLRFQYQDLPDYIVDPADTEKVSKPLPSQN